MTNEEAIRLLRMEQLGDSEKMELAKFMGAQALEKQTPKKPIDEGDDFGDSSLCCPTCIGPVTNYWAPGTLPKHCQFCGQALDWEGLKT